jgi:hypothetical protein
MELVEQHSLLITALFALTDLLVSTQATYLVLLCNNTLLTTTPQLIMQLTHAVMEQVTQHYLLVR